MIVCDVAFNQYHNYVCVVCVCMYVCMYVCVHTVNDKI